MSAKTVTIRIISIFAVSILLALPVRAQEVTAPAAAVAQVTSEPVAAPAAPPVVISDNKGNIQTLDTPETEGETTPTTHFAAPAIAPDIDILPAKSVAGGDLLLNPDDDTHPPIRLTPDKSELVRLDSDAATIIVGNPEHLSVLAESARTLVLVPKMPGATHISILDKHSNVIMQRHVIVAAPTEKYVRIRRSCATSGKGSNCEATQVYYCPDMCHEIRLVGEKAKEADNSEAFDSLEALSKGAIGNEAVTGAAPAPTETH